jgi:hypothetical protein
MSDKVKKKTNKNNKIGVKNKLQIIEKEIKTEEAIGFLVELVEEIIVEGEKKPKKVIEKKVVVVEKPITEKVTTEKPVEKSKEPENPEGVDEGKKTEKEERLAKRAASLKRLKARQKGEKGDRGPSGGGVGRGQTGAKGDPGEKGDKGDDGLSIYWRGEYDPAIQYYVLNAVSYQGSSYICKVASKGNLPTDGTYWDLMAVKGTDIDYGIVAALVIALG